MSGLSPRTWNMLYHALDDHMKELVRGSSIALILQLVGAGLGFALNIVVARFLGAEGAGMYFLALALVTIASTLGRFGLDNSLIRFIASNSSVGNFSAVKGVYMKSMRYALICSFLLASFVALLAPRMATDFFYKPDLGLPLRLMSLAVIPFAIYFLHASALRGLKHIGGAASIQSVWARIFAILGIAILAPSWGVEGAVCGYTLAALATMLLAIRLWHKKTYPKLKSIPGYFPAKTLLQSSIPLFWVVALNLTITWSSIILLGVWTSSDSVGIFSVAHRTVLLMVFFLHAVNSIAAPKFAEMHKKGDMHSMERIARNAAKFLMMASSPFLVIFIILPTHIMQIFGSEFIKGATALSILAAGQFVNISTGSVGYLLMMSGYEKLMRNNMAVCAGINFILNIILIPRTGITGAAVATALALALQNLIAFGLVWNKLGIVTLPFVPRNLFLKSGNSWEK
jgi:O-antigen/teichoic acid export membrane protein